MADTSNNSDTSYIPMGEALFYFFQSHSVLSEAVLTRKGRITAKEVITSFGDNGYLSDTFSIGQVIQRNKVLVRETLVCNGRGNCQRLCGGFGQCIKDCDASNKRGSMGHRCRVKVKLTMSTDHFGIWKVVVSGHHVPPGHVWSPPTKSALTDLEKRQELEEAWLAGCQSTREIALAVGNDTVTKAEIQNFIRIKRRQLQTTALRPRGEPRAPALTPAMTPTLPNFYPGLSLPRVFPLQPAPDLPPASELAGASSFPPPPDLPHPTELPRAPNLQSDPHLPRAPDTSHVPDVQRPRPLVPYSDDESDSDS